MTAQISPDDITAFLNGQTQPVLRLTCAQQPFVIDFVRSAQMSVSVELPLVPPPRNDLFDIHKALASHHWTVLHQTDGNTITLFSRDRSELRQMIGIATLHLGWHDDDTIDNSFVADGNRTGNVG